jgi:hypothetical protein
MYSISTIILTVLANFLGIIIQFFQNALVATMATLPTARAHAIQPDIAAAPCAITE